MRGWGRGLTIAAFALALAACATTDEDNTIGSRLAQPPAGTPRQKPVDASDIAIVGQEVSHSIMELPAVAEASVPPLVRFTEVTSILDKPVDTDPYTQLLRDRLLVLTREKLRFVERTLPPYVPPSKKGRKAPPRPAQNTTEPDYQILAELRGHAEDEFYKIQVEFVDIHTNEVLFDGLYRIRRETSLESPPEPSGDTRAFPGPDMTAPTTVAPEATGNGTL